MDLTLLFDSVLTLMAGMFSKLIGITFYAFGVPVDLFSLLISFLFLSVVLSIFWHKAHK